VHLVGFCYKNIYIYIYIYIPVKLQNILLKFHRFCHEKEDKNKLKSLVYGNRRETKETEVEKARNMETRRMRTLKAAADIKELL